MKLDGLRRIMCYAIFLDINFVSDAGMSYANSTRNDDRAFGRRLNFISPHSDDAALSMACSLRELAKRGCSIVIINCFSLSDWAPRVSGSLTLHHAGSRLIGATRSETDPNWNPRRVSALRRAEDEKFGALIHDTVTMEWLDLPDAPLRPDWRLDSNACRVPADKEVQAQYTAILASQLQAFSVPGCAWAAPLALAHRDHRIARAATEIVAADAPYCLYEEVPYTFAANPTDRMRLAAPAFASEEPQRVSLYPNFESEFWRAAVACYVSQFDGEQIDSILQDLIDQGGEHVWASNRFNSWLANTELGFA
jgi:LmbE family N-acetylglucosaminyl deacetylase